MNKKAFLEIEGLDVAFSRWGQTFSALNALDLSVEKGEWVMLIGPNGSGKSTLLRAISGRVQPERGAVTLLGKDVLKMSTPERAMNLFHIHQDPLLGTAPVLTVFENLAVADYQGKIEREPKHALLKKYTELLQPLGLSDRMKQPARTLSGGERQLLALLIARLRPAPLVLLDEPLAALDPGRAEICLKELVRLHEQGKTLIQVTHEEDHAVSLGSRTVALNEGRVVYDETSSARSADAIRNHWQAHAGV